MSEICECEFKAGLPTERRTAKPATKAGHCLCRRQHGARVVSGQRHLRLLVDHSMCRVGRSEEFLLDRRAVKTHAAKRNCQTTLGSFLKLVQKRTLPLVEDVKIHGALVAYSNDCLLQGVQHHHWLQLLAAVMDRWPSFSCFGSGKLPRFHRCLKGDRSRRRVPNGQCQHQSGKA